MTKKVLAALLLPVPAVITAMLISLLLLFICPRSSWGRRLLSASFFLLTLFSTPFLPSFLLNHLEQQYTPITKLRMGIKYIVVLGAGNGGKSNYAANNKLSSASLARLIEGIRLKKLLPKSILYLSGGRVFSSPADGVVMNNTATMLGVDRKYIRVEAGSKDTAEEANKLKRRIGNAPFYLVTSAYHMPRAMALFKHAGMHPVAAPTQFLIHSNRFCAKCYLPNSTNLVYSDIALHEYLGMLWGKLTGII